MPAKVWFHVEIADPEAPEGWAFDRSYETRQGALLWQARLRRKGHFARIQPRNVPGKRVQSENTEKKGARRQWLVK